MGWGSLKVTRTLQNIQEVMLEDIVAAEDRLQFLKAGEIFIGLKDIHQMH